MAYTATVIKKTTHGDEKVHHYLVTADGATGSFDTALGFINGVSVTPKSLTSTVPNVRLNEGVASTSIAGTVAVTGATNGDSMYVTVFGR